MIDDADHLEPYIHLGIDSQFAMVETVITFIFDTMVRLKQCANDL